MKTWTLFLDLFKLFSVKTDRNIQMVVDIFANFIKGMLYFGSNSIANSKCRSGEIGRRTGFKILRGQPRVGSIPTSGTTHSREGESLLMSGGNFLFRFDISLSIRTRYLTEFVLFMQTPFFYALWTPDKS